MNSNNQFNTAWVCDDGSGEIENGGISPSLSNSNDLNPLKWRKSNNDRLNEFSRPLNNLEDCGEYCAPSNSWNSVNYHYERVIAPPKTTTINDSQKDQHYIRKLFDYDSESESYSDDHHCWTEAANNSWNNINNSGKTASNSHCYTDEQDTILPVRQTTNQDNKDTQTSNEHNTKPIDWNVYGHDSISFNDTTVNKPVKVASAEKPNDLDDIYYTPTTLRMSEAIDGSLYLSIPSVFKHVTLGGKLTESMLLDIGKYIVNSNSTLKSRPKIKIRNVNDISGMNKEIYIKQYRWEDYRLIAKACLEWLYTL